MGLWKQRKRGIMLLVIIALLTSGFLYIQTRKEAPQTFYTQFSQLNGNPIGMLMGEYTAKQFREDFPDSQLLNYRSKAELIEALRSGWIAAYLTTDSSAELQAERQGNLAVLHGATISNEEVFATSREQEALCRELSEQIDALRREGALDALADKWLVRREYTEPQIPEDGERGILDIAVDVDNAPFVFWEQGTIMGYDVDVITLAAKNLGYGVRLNRYSGGALIDSILRGRENVAMGGITDVDERPSTLRFTSPICTLPAAAVVLAGEQRDEGALVDAIRLTLLSEGRWKMILSGIGVTTLLSFVTVVGGTLLGFGFSLLMQSENRAMAKLVSRLLSIFDTLPLLIIFMLLYYVLFAAIDISAITISIIGLMLSFAITVADLLNTGLLAVERCQIDGARALGYRNWQILLKVAFPQAFGQMYDQYTGAVTEIIKDTSIVGFITVQDITSVTDLIRSATYQSFFPLLLVSVVYFVLAKLFLLMLSAGMRYFVPDKRERRIRGVDRK